MSDRQDAQEQRKSELVVTGPVPKEELEQPEQQRPVLAVTLGNVVLTDVGVEITLVLPKEVVFVEQPTQVPASEQTTED